MREHILPLGESDWESRTFRPGEGNAACQWVQFLITRKSPTRPLRTRPPHGGRAAFKLFIGYNLQPCRWREGRTFERPGRAFS
jgi:hypothetical protein